MSSRAQILQSLRLSAMPAGKGKRAVWGTIHNFFGEVEIYDWKNDKSLGKAKVGMAVHMVESVRTEKGGACNVRLTNGRMLTIVSDSEAFIS